jgi:F-type H+-transporting ATPase subunit c
MDASAASLIGAGLAVMGVIGSGIGIGTVFAAYIQAIGRNPSAKNDVRTELFLGFALVEALALFALIVALLLLFVVKA